MVFFTFLVYRYRLPGRAGAVMRILMPFTTLLLYLLSTDAVADYLMYRLERAIPTQAGEILAGEVVSDAIVVLGGGSLQTSPAEEGSGALSAEAESRLLYGYRLGMATGLPVIVSGGTVFERGIPEAEIAAELLVDLGMPASRILVETESRTTAENARFTVERFGVERPVIVTSAYHMRRAVLAFQAVGTDPRVAPCAYRTDDSPGYPDRFLPKSTALENTSVVWRETVGYVWYLLQK